MCILFFSRGALAFPIELKNALKNDNESVKCFVFHFSPVARDLILIQFHSKQGE